MEMGKDYQNTETVSNGLSLILFLKVWVLFARVKTEPCLAVVNPHWLGHFHHAMDSERYWIPPLFPLATLHLFFVHLGKSVLSLLLTFKRNVGVEAGLVPSGVSLNLLSISLGCSREEAHIQRLTPSMEGGIAGGSAPCSQPTEKHAWLISGWLEEHQVRKGGKQGRGAKAWYRYQKDFTVIGRPERRKLGDKLCKLVNLAGLFTWGRNIPYNWYDFTSCKVLVIQ